MSKQVIDPVCGMTISSEGALSREHAGEVFFLCSELCVGRFETDAAAYVAVSRLNLEGWGRTPTPGFLMKETRSGEQTA